MLFAILDPRVAPLVTMTAMRIAVTGGSGRIGSVVIRELVERGHDVINLDRRQAREPIAKFACVELGSWKEVETAIAGVDAVCHLGEIPHTNAGNSPEQVLAENTKIASTVLLSCEDLNIPRVIYASTCQVYGLWDAPITAVPKSLPFDETHPIAPHNAYAMSKATNEISAAMASERSGMSVAIFRLPWVPEWEYSESWEAQERVKPTSTDGFCVYCHVSDVAKAFVLAVEKPRAGCEVYNFSAAEILSLYPLAGRLREHHPDYPELPSDWPAFKSPLISQKARDHFGWSPKWNWLDYYREKHGRVMELA